MLAMETEWKEWNYETKEKKNGQELVIGEIEIRIIWGVPETPGLWAEGPGTHAALGKRQGAYRGKEF